jgi:hypothetical protein
VAKSKLPGGSNRDDFPERVKRALADRVGLLCSNPECMKPTKGPHTEDNKVRNIGKACHIHAAAKGGPRFDENQTPEERRAAANGIWLCSNHAAEVDVDEARFPADLLKRWKAEAENAAAVRMQSPGVKKSAALLLAAASDLLGHPQVLPDGTWLDRPELNGVREMIERNDGDVVALLGPPGSGKSAFLAKLGSDLRRDGWNVVAIKADRLPSSVATAGDIQRYFDIDLPFSQAVYALSQTARTVLMVDQLDALADLADAKTERLAVLLSVISSVKASGIPVLCSVRDFDFKHDTRFMGLDAEQVQLAPLVSADVEAVLRRRGMDVAQVGSKLTSLLAIPNWLKQFVQMTWHNSLPLPTTSQALLETVWQQTVLRVAADATENDTVASRIAEMIADREELWIPRAELAGDEPALQRLMALGTLVSDGTRLRVSFAHQTLYEFARARAFARSKRLSEYVSEHQDSLFLRPTIWASLHYLRAVAPERYREELGILWKTARRSHLQLLLMEFVGQADPPDHFEIALLTPRFGDERWARPAFNAAARSPSWLRHLCRGILPRSMIGAHAGATYGAIVASLKLERDETLALMARYWGGAKEFAGLLIGVLRNLEDWTPQARDLLDEALSQIQSPEHVLDTFAWQLKEKAPAYAIELIARFLERSFKAREATLQHSEPPPEDASFEERVRWDVSKEPERTIKEVYHLASAFHVLMELAKADPGVFLRRILPWISSVLSVVAEVDQWHPSYAVDHIFDCSDTMGPVRELPHALRAASETLATADADAFFALCSEWSASNLETIHVILSYGYERLRHSRPGEVAAYLLADGRRLKLGQPSVRAARSVAVLESIRETVAPADVRLLEQAIVASQCSSESTQRAVISRKAASMINREHRLRLLQALPAAHLSAPALSRMEQEVRVFGELGRKTQVVGFKEIGSPMSAAQMELAGDEEVLRLFEQLPDSTGFHHPTRFMEGGAVEAARELEALAKNQPRRAVDLIEQMQPGQNEIPVAHVISALAETDMATPELVDLVVRLHRRGFSSEQFRDDAASALTRRAGKHPGLPEPAVDMLRSWLAEVPVGARTKALLTSDDNRGAPPFLLGLGGALSLPAGNFTVLDALLVSLLSAKPPRAAEWLAVLREHLERDDEPFMWRAFAYRLKHLHYCEAPEAAEFLTKLFNRYPEALECAGGVLLIAWSSWWATPHVVKVWIDLLSGSTWQHAPTAVGELTALLAIQRQPLPWAEEDLRKIVALHDATRELIGAAEMVADLWQDPARRARATPYLCTLVDRGAPEVDEVVLKRIAHDGVGADDLALDVLRAFTDRSAPPPIASAHDLVSWVSTLVHADPRSVHLLLASLVAAAATAGDGSMRLGSSAVELVNTALTLQRMPSFREQGLDLFERLLALDLYGARSALEEIDAVR